MSKVSDELRSQPAGVRVKGLEWVKIFDWGHDLKADTILGGYTISIDGPGAGGASNLWLAGADTDTFEVFDTLTEAKAAAEADYRQRILSALEPQQEEAVADEDRDQPTPEQRVRLLTKFGGTSEYSKGFNDAIERACDLLYAHPTPVQKVQKVRR